MGLLQNLFRRSKKHEEPPKVAQPKRKNRDINARINSILIALMGLGLAFSGLGFFADQPGSTPAESELQQDDTPAADSTPIDATPDDAAPPEPEPKPEPQKIDFDGLAQIVFDTTVRIRNRNGTGSGSCVADLGDVYEIESNHHVAGDPGKRNIIDIWSGGDLVDSTPETTVNSWFENGRSKDVAILHVKKSKLSRPMAVVPTAPHGYSKTIKPGDKVYTIGCSDGRWPRARCGNVLLTEDGLIYYDPKSIGGDSGSGVYHFSIADQKWYCVGRTAWAIRENNRWVGLAMDSDRVHAIREGRVSTGWKLPTGAIPIDEIDFGDDARKPDFDLPNTALRLDVMRLPDSPPDECLPISICR